LLSAQSYDIKVVVEKCGVKSRFFEIPSKQCDMNRISLGNFDRDSSSSFIYLHEGYKQLRSMRKAEKVA
jgi:hypothetical protein